jgi:NAD(P)-dependent dehydrogenase (short-subunit alcohol dehydrogenase family)
MIAKTVEKYGQLNCAVSNAGTEVVGNIVDQTAEHFDLLLDTNVKGVFYCLKHELRQMMKNGGGAIVNQSSVTSSLTGVPGNGLYAATKGAVIALTKTAALEGARHNISVNAIAACAIDVPGDMIWQWIKETGTSPQQIMAALPVGRMGKAEELVAAVMFLCSDEARFITGHTLPVDGGFLAQSVRYLDLTCTDSAPLTRPTLPACENRCLRREDPPSRIFRCQDSKLHRAPRPRLARAPGSVCWLPPGKSTLCDHRI